MVEIAHLADISTLLKLLYGRLKRLLERLIALVAQGVDLTRQLDLVSVAKLRFRVVSTR